jgi:spore germination cell wall hydrolase CwlJ-like protein
LTKPTQARAEARALLNAVLVGAAIGTTTAGALASVYLMGGMAQEAVTHARVAKLADAAADGLSQDFLLDMSSADPGALAVALRQDPNLLTGYAPRDRTDELAARLDAKAASAQSHLLRASLAPANPAARPYQMGALDQSRQADCLAQAVYYEARGESPAGQAAVAQGVLNRVRHPAFPKSICSVVYQGAQTGHGCQFSFACDGSTRRPREPAAWRRAQKVATKALNGYVMAAVGNSTHFHVTNVSPNWGPRLLRVSQVGAHIFYRFGGRAGRPGAFTATPRLDKPEALLASMTVTPKDATPAEAAAKGAAVLVGAVMHVDAPTSALAAPAMPAVAKPAVAKPAVAKPAVPKPEAIKAETVKTDAVAKAREPMAAADAGMPAV